MKGNYILMEDMTPQEIVAHINSLSKSELSLYIEDLIDEFMLTDNSAKRNSLALILAEYGKERAVEPIVKMIKDPRTHNNKGTLLYSLRDLNYGKHLDFIFTLLFESSFEVKREAYTLIAQSIEHSTCDIEKLKTQIGLLIKAIDELQGDIDLYVSVLKILIK